MHDYGEAIRFAEQQLKLGKELHNRVSFFRYFFKYINIFLEH